VRLANSLFACAGTVSALTAAVGSSPMQHAVRLKKP
jgi:hypothetical protein